MTRTTTPTLHLVHNNAEDTLLLERDGRIVSEWTVGPDDPRTLVAEGLLARDWPVHDEDGLTIDDRPARIADYGTPVLSVSERGWTYHDSALAASRAAYYGVLWPTTTAEAVSAALGHDGLRHETDAGVTLEDLCANARARLACARLERDDAGCERVIEVGPQDVVGRERYTFADGSAIVVAGDAWDVEGAEPWSWAGA